MSFTWNKVPFQLFCKLHGDVRLGVKQAQRQWQQEEEEQEEEDIAVEAAARGPDAKSMIRTAVRRLAYLTRQCDQMEDFSARRVGYVHMGSAALTGTGSNLVNPGPAKGHVGAAVFLF